MIISIIIWLLTLLLLGTFTFFSLRRDGWRRYAGPIGFIFVSVCTIFGYSQTLGGCIPQWAAINTKMDILAIAYNEPHSIYLWGVQDQSPKCIVLPWIDEQARQIRGQENEGGPLEYVHGNSDGKGVIHPKPQEALPPKDATQ